MLIKANLNGMLPQGQQQLFVAPSFSKAENDSVMRYSLMATAFPIMWLGRFKSKRLIIT